jgi:hypothetical protein
VRFFLHTRVLSTLRVQVPVRRNTVGLLSVRKIARVIGHAQDIRYMPPPNTEQYANTYIEIYSWHTYYYYPSMPWLAGLRELIRRRRRRPSDILSNFDWLDYPLRHFWLARLPPRYSTPYTGATLASYHYFSARMLGPLRATCSIIILITTFNMKLSGTIFSIVKSLHCDSSPCTFFGLFSSINFYL